MSAFAASLLAGSGAVDATWIPLWIMIKSGHRELNDNYTMKTGAKPPPGVVKFVVWP